MVRRTARIPASIRSNFACNGEPETDRFAQEERGENLSVDYDFTPEQIILFSEGIGETYLRFSSLYDATLD